MDRGSTDIVNHKERVLVVDDDPAIRKLIRQKLSREGYVCTEAESAAWALEHLGRDHVHLVILDIKMPEKSGIELLPQIKAEYPDVAVIMATSVTEIAVAIECIKHGADDYIAKPFDLDEIMLAVEKAIEKRQLQLSIKEYQQYLEEKVEAQANEIRKLFLGAIEALVFALEAKDRYTAGHSRRVTEIALAIGHEMGLAPDEISDLYWGSLLHDVGKIAVDQLIQNKPGKLTREEYEHIMIHAHLGAGIVKPVVNEKVVDMIEHHHDHYDGSGLHQVLVGSAIPVAARILAVADAFDAMTSDRPYRLAMSMQEAIDEVRRCNGSQFDPVVVDAFFKTEIVTRLPAET